MSKLVLFFLGILVISACKKMVQPGEAASLDSIPVYVFKNIETKYSEDAITIITITAPLEYQYSNGNVLYPEGLHVDFFQNNRLTTVIDADSAIFDKKDNLYTAFNNVKVANKIKKQRLETNMLIWKPKQYQIESNAKVKITTLFEIIHGVGLTARQDFSEYTIKRPTGIMAIR